MVNGGGFAMPGSFGASDKDNGLFANTKANDKVGIFGSNESPNPPAGGGAGGAGVFGLTASPGGAGVFGANNTPKGVGVQGNGPDAGVSGFSAQAVGVLGSGKTGVAGQTNSDTDAGVNGRNDGKGFGVFGFSQSGHGVEGHSASGIGIVGFAEKGLAGRFIGDVEVTGDIRLTNADCAEEFEVASADEVEPGTVMVLGKGGILEPSQVAYDKRVAGVISGAGDCKPGIVLDKRGAHLNRKPIALLGKVFCKVDANYSPVEIGDLLTTSLTPGHAMKASDQAEAFGAVIGKALQPLATGHGLIPVLVALK
jgi:hypothetical protein